MKIGYLVKIQKGYTQTKTHSELMIRQLFFLKKVEQVTNVAFLCNLSYTITFPQFKFIFSLWHYSSRVLYLYATQILQTKKCFIQNTDAANISTIIFFKFSLSQDLNMGTIQIIKMNRAPKCGNQYLSMQFNI